MDALLQAFLAILKAMGTGALKVGELAGKGAVGLGKAAVTGAKVGTETLGRGAAEVGKWGWNRM